MIQVTSRDQDDRHAHIKSFNCKRDAFAHSLSLLTSYCPDMTEILLKQLKSQVVHHPSILFLRHESRDKQTTEHSKLG